ncbi:protein of unknown function [Cupriavidus taiwanensis]|uniref:Thioesterase domain-containing protein n=1 Tax=Cupriavidus taiwanensis TaxID=164546 RepID=A0A9Q7UVV3_9BURK|nr:protein of unknown function [Cupriavidus taiwanensis]
MSRAARAITLRQESRLFRSPAMPPTIAAVPLSQDRRPAGVDPRMRAMVDNVLLGSPVARALGLRLASLAPDHVELEMPFLPTNVTHGSIVHGGVIATLIDIDRHCRRGRGCVRCQCRRGEGRGDRFAVDPVPGAGARCRAAGGGIGGPARPPAGCDGCLGVRRSARRRRAGCQGLDEQCHVLSALRLRAFY